jgi:cytoskeletal protein RodZ
MNRDILKTAGGIVLIGVIIVATFLYGNRQRQVQLQQKNQATKQQQQQQTSNQTKQPPKVAQNNSTAPGNSESGAPATTQSAPTSTPATGSSTWVVLPLGLIVALYQIRKTTKRSLRAQILNPETR